MNLTMTQLENCFSTAKNLNYRYVAIQIDILGYDRPETLISPIQNFNRTLQYFKEAYDDNLILKESEGNIRIVNFVMADTYETIEDELFNPYIN